MTLNIFACNIKSMQPYTLMLQTDPDDRLITEDVLSEIHVDIPVKFLYHFDEIASFVSLEGPPSLVIINEGGLIDAVDILRRLKNNKVYHSIPAVILTERTMEDDVIEYYKAGASTVITKPSTVELTQKKIQIFFTYWLNVAELPGRLSIQSN
jgi:DNA-binding response OmpR family regulator